LLVTFLLLASMAGGASAGETTGGEDTNPGTDVPFTVVERTSPSRDGTTWSLSIELSQEAKENGTTAIITTQICLNSGVCDPPVDHEPTVEDGVYSMELKPPTDHSYVNWRVKATYADDSKENFPSGDWYKTWSTCYYNDGAYGGVHADGDGCNVPALDEEENSLPALGIGLILATVTMATAARYVRKG
jgi:hypothetical protein